MILVPASAGFLLFRTSRLDHQRNSTAAFDRSAFGPIADLATAMPQRLLGAITGSKCHANKMSNCVLSDRARRRLCHGNAVGRQRV